MKSIMLASHGKQLVPIVRVRVRVGFGVRVRVGFGFGVRVRVWFGVRAGGNRLLLATERTCFLVPTQLDDLKLREGGVLVPRVMGTLFLGLGLRCS